MLIFLFNVGCRFGDMVKMKIGDFDYDTEEINGKRLVYFSFFMEKIKIQKERGCHLCQSLMNLKKNFQRNSI